MQAQCQASGWCMLWVGCGRKASSYEHVVPRRGHRLSSVWGLALLSLGAAVLRTVPDTYSILGLHFPPKNHFQLQWASEFASVDTAITEVPVSSSGRASCHFTCRQALLHFQGCALCGCSGLPRRKAAWGLGCTPRPPCLQSQMCLGWSRRLLSTCVCTAPTCSVTTCLFVPVFCQEHMWNIILKVSTISVHIEGNS